MIKRTIMAGVATAALASTTLGLAGTAHAAPKASSAQTCSITNILPDQVVIGTEGKRVQFGVRTTCDDQDIKWNVRGALVGTSAHGFWFAACNYHMTPGPWNFDCSHEGSGVINPIGGTYRGYDFIPGNDLTGPNPINATAFVDANHNSEDDDPGDSFSASETITLLRQTKFGRSFDAAPEPVRKGKRIYVSATLSTADWNEGFWDEVDGKVQVQFKALGSKKWHTVKTVKAKDGELDTAVKAVRSGHWRAYHPEDEATGSSTSNSDYVKVKARR
jgi:hypothetical protein